MPLDGHSYLIAQGWGGKGTGLRQGAISRPLAIPQKKNLAGLGKDRDEAFPFWDHLFSAAAKSIQVKLLSDGDEDGNESDPANSVSVATLKRTTTGILSTRRPVEGTPATSGTNTPDAVDQTRQFSLLATAKREAAKRGLYARFFRGPVLGPDSDETRAVAQTILTEDVELETTVTENAKKRKQKTDDDDGERERKKRKKEKEKKKKRGNEEAEKEFVELSKKSRSKRKEIDTEDADDSKSAEKAERRRLRRELKEAKKKLQSGIEAGQLCSDSEDRARRKEKKRLKKEARSLEGTGTVAQTEIVEGGKMNSSRTLDSACDDILDKQRSKKKRKHCDIP